MPRVNKVMQLLPGTYGSPNTTVKSAPYNAQVDDFVAEMNGLRPIEYGGTAAATAVGGADNLATIGANIASAATTDIGAATGVSVGITGTTTITSFGTKTAGVMRYLNFGGVLTLTHNATSLILPTGANITTAAGDTCVAQSLGGGNWRVISYQSALALPGKIISTDAGATVGPTLTLFRDSASPAASDLIGNVSFDGRDSAGNIETYANVFGTIEDPTNTSEDSSLTVSTKIAGSLVPSAKFTGGTTTLTLVDAGATVGPDLKLFRDSASPANVDLIGRLLFQGRDSAGNVQDYADITGRITNATSASEGGRLNFNTTGGGVTKTIATIDGFGVGVDGDVTATNGTFSSVLSANTLSGVSVTSSFDVTVGRGVQFPATQSPSADANNLDDYEEGTWTPAYSFSTGGTAGFVYSNQSGTYTKTGRGIIATFDNTVSTLGSGSGTATLTGLPVAAIALSSGPVGLYASMTSISGALTVLAVSTVLQIKIGGTTGTSDLNKTNMSATTRMSGTVAYQA